jgi:hypothetical protein
LISGAASLVGCGSGDPPLNNTKMTEEQIRVMKEEDKRIDDEERSGSGTAVGRKKR